jgi:hypothetical protein
MPEFFVWSMPKLVRVIEATDELEAASIFLEEPASAEPDSGAPPACFVQATRGSSVPRVEDTVIEFWPASDEAAIPETPGEDYDGSPV